MTEQTEAEKNIAPGLLNTIRRWSLLIELVHDTAQMRYYQKAFFKERENAKLKNELLQKARDYEKKVDILLISLWPEAGDKPKQQNLF